MTLSSGARKTTPGPTSSGFLPPASPRTSAGGSSTLSHFSTIQELQVENIEVAGKGYAEVVIGADEVAVATSPRGTAHALVNVGPERTTFFLGCQDSIINYTGSGTDFNIWKDLFLLVHAFSTTICSGVCKLQLHLICFRDVSVATFSSKSSALYWMKSPEIVTKKTPT
ncbi:hypothetical protein SAY86_018793 [Trapa natans]|uniref:Uncharacterized protein n=1 Tax=Trapa natans TaxID=22666 RepID=A0AAN7LFN0_TRANT|nr:hypothetical protein SAY86_018793 [Trapa natans]